jgi:hypothetical protein
VSEFFVCDFHCHALQRLGNGLTPPFKELAISTLNMSQNGLECIHREIRRRQVSEEH